MSDIVLLVPESTRSGFADIARIERTVMAQAETIGSLLLLTIFKPAAIMEL